MSRRAVLRRNCAEALLLCALAPPGCMRSERLSMRQDARLGQFTLCATSVEVYSRSHQGVPLEVEVIFSLRGGNRFERYDFTEAVTRKGRITFRTSQGWSDRVGLSGKSDDVRTLHVIANPPARSSGYTLEIGNPYGEPGKYILDLGR